MSGIKKERPQYYPQYYPLDKHEKEHSLCSHPVCSRADRKYDICCQCYGIFLELIYLSPYRFDKKEIIEMSHLMDKAVKDTGHICRFEYLLEVKK